MKLVVQRVVRPKDKASGVNAYCYLHPGRQWLDAPPGDLGRGTLARRLIEVDPPANNNVRSYLDITTPDMTTNDEIVQVVASGAEFLMGADRELPWTLSHGETAFEFNLELGLVDQWQIELRLLLGYALQVRSG